MHEGCDSSSPSASLSFQHPSAAVALPAAALMSLFHKQHCEWCSNALSLSTMNSSGRNITASFFSCAACKTAGWHCSRCNQTDLVIKFDQLHAFNLSTARCCKTRAVERHARSCVEMAHDQMVASSSSGGRLPVSPSGSLSSSSSLSDDDAPPMLSPSPQSSPQSLQSSSPPYYKQASRKCNQQIA